MVSYECGSRSVVRRLDPVTGTALWTSRSPAGSLLHVSAAASDGGLVLLWGTSAAPAASRLPRRYTWPAALSQPTTAVALALDASTGRPRWAELGGPGVLAGSLRLRVVRVASGATAALVRLGFVLRAYGGDARQAFVVAGEPLGPSQLLILVRRNDLRGSPVLALAVTA